MLRALSKIAGWSGGLEFQNAANIMSKMLQIQCAMKGSTSDICMPCKMHGSISKMRVEVPRKYDANWGSSKQLPRKNSKLTDLLPTNDSPFDPFAVQAATENTSGDLGAKALAPVIVTLISGRSCRCTSSTKPGRKCAPYCSRVLLGISWNLLLWQSMTHIPSHSKTPCFQWSFRSFLLDCLPQWPQWPQFLILAVLAPHRIGASDGLRNSVTQAILRKIVPSGSWRKRRSTSTRWLLGLYRGVLTVIEEIQRGQVWGLGCGMLWLWPSSVLVQAASSLRKGPCASSLTGTLNSWKILKGSKLCSLKRSLYGDPMSFLAVASCGFIGGLVQRYCWFMLVPCAEILWVFHRITEIWWVLSRDPWGFCWHREVKRGLVFFDHFDHWQE